MAQRNLIGTALLLAGLLAALAGPSPAQRPEDDPAFQRNLLRWNAMKPADRDAVRARYEGWKAMSGEQQARLRANFQRYHKMDPEEQRSLADVHASWVADADADRRQALQRRLERYRQLDEGKRSRALAVGWFLRESGQEVRAELDKRSGAERQRALGALRDLYAELPAELRARLDKLPPWRRQMVVRHIIAERRGRFAQVFSSNLDVPVERFVLRELLRELPEAERRQFAQLPQRHKQRVIQQLMRAPDEHRARMLQRLLRQAAERGNQTPRDGKRRPGGKPPK